MALINRVTGRHGHLPYCNYSSMETMLSFRKLTRKLIIVLPAVFCLSNPRLYAAPTSYTPQILQYVSEDKVYLLENIRKNISIPSEKLVVDALLSEDGPQAAYLYRKQLAEYPDPSLDELSRTRLSAFQFVLSGPLAFPESVPPMAPPPDAGKPAATVPVKEKPVQQKIIATPPATPVSETGLYTLQFGSFSNRANAENLVSELSAYGSVSIIQQGGLHKVRLQKSWRTEKEAKIAGSSIPFTSVAVPLR
ncbi:MAG: SPOR domain-containing protein [Chlorobium sp.]|uniref:SPOR domain-containing protein n=1 Tax=Chlorobium sp. TaxID=1095 RepID=UPI0025BCFA4B|nr:SPOR domain-containing protein [Chlorobium sp.]MCF8382664.1 SPOR domain-containing protein [Chlorobium sp.]